MNFRQEQVCPIYFEFVPVLMKKYAVSLAESIFIFIMRIFFFHLETTSSPPIPLAVIDRIFVKLRILSWYAASCDLSGQKIYAGTTFIKLFEKKQNEKISQAISR